MDWRTEYISFIEIHEPSLPRGPCTRFQRMLSFLPPLHSKSWVIVLANCGRLKGRKMRRAQTGRQRSTFLSLSLVAVMEAQICVGTSIKIDADWDIALCSLYTHALRPSLVRTRSASSWRMRRNLFLTRLYLVDPFLFTTFQASFSSFMLNKGAKAKEPSRRASAASC